MRKPILSFLVFATLFLFASPICAMGTAPSPTNVIESLNPTVVILTGYQTVEGVISLIGNEPFTELSLTVSQKVDEPTKQIRIVGQLYPKLSKLQNKLIRVEGWVSEQKSRWSNYQIDVRHYRLYEGNND